jgi:hypothetical protein
MIHLAGWSTIFGMRQSIEQRWAYMRDVMSLSVIG